MSAPAWKQRRHRQRTKTVWRWTRREWLRQVDLAERVQPPGTPMRFGAWLLHELSGGRR